jgi:hypothetical protein
MTGRLGDWATENDMQPIPIEWEGEEITSCDLVSPHCSVAPSPRRLVSLIGVSFGLFVRGRRRFVFKEQDEQGQDNRREDGRFAPQWFPFDGFQ